MNTATLLHQEEKERARQNDNNYRLLRGGSCSSILSTAVRRFAATILRAAGATLSVFVLYVPQRALFCARTGGWEFTGRAEEESRPVPVMSVTASENQTGRGNLVSSAERLLDL